MTLSVVHYRTGNSCRAPRLKEAFRLFLGLQTAKTRERSSVKVDAHGQVFAPGTLQETRAPAAWPQGVDGGLKEPHFRRF
jgi:hypothetical protein